MGSPVDFILDESVRRGARDAGLRFSREKASYMRERVSSTTKLNSRFGFLEPIDVPALVAACPEPRYNQTLCQVNDCVVRLGLMQGGFHWHKHDEQDEFSPVLQGKLLIDLDSGTITLGPHRVTRFREASFTVPERPKDRRSSW